MNEVTVVNAIRVLSAVVILACVLTGVRMRGDVRAAGFIVPLLLAAVAALVFVTAPSLVGLL